MHRFSESQIEFMRSENGGKGLNFFAYSNENSVKFESYCIHNRKTWNNCEKTLHICPNRV